MNDIINFFQIFYRIVYYMGDFEKYEKYKIKYLELKEENQKLKSQNGGGDEKQKKKYEGESYILNVKSINIKQKGEYTYDVSMSRKPAFRIRFYTKSVPKAKVIKSILHFVNKNLRMKFVKNVTITQGKKKDKLAGDKLEGEIDISKEITIDDITINMT